MSQFYIEWGVSCFNILINIAIVVGLLAFSTVFFVCGKHEQSKGNIVWGRFLNSLSWVGLLIFAGYVFK